MVLSLSEEVQTTVEGLRGRAVISVDELARVLDVGRGEAYAAVHRGEVPSLRIGRRIVIPTPALLRMLGADSESS